MSKARDLANAGTALGAVTATELGYVDGVTSAIQTQIDSKEATLPSQTGNSGKYLTTNGTAKSWGTVSQYALPTQTGNSGKYLTTNGTAESWGIVTSPTTFTFRQNLGIGINQIAYNGSNLYVAIGNGGEIFTSPDATTWTSRTSGVSTSLNSIVYGNSIWVAVGASGVILSSTDGTTWTSRTSGVSTNALNAVIYANSLFVAVGAGANGGTGGITTSTNGTTWTKRNTPTTSSNTLVDVAYGGGYYVTVGNGNTNSGYYSTDGTTWTVTDVGTGQDMQNVYYINGTWVSNKLNFNGGAGVNGSTPNTTWSADFNQMVSRSQGKQAYGIYGNTLYHLTPSVGTNLTNVNHLQFIVGVTSNEVGATTFSSTNPIIVPTSFGAVTGRGIYVNPSNGQFTFFDGSGRIYTSF